MSKHRSSSDECCYGGYGYGGYGGGGAGYYGGWGIRWIYALLVLIVIVLQFGRNQKPAAVSTCVCDEAAPATTDGFFNNQLIDNSVLFIIVVFLLILCAGCWTGGYGNYGGGYGY